jgi:hypothetical protein
MDVIEALLLPVVGGMLLCIGFNFQERTSGVLMVWLGMMLILGTVVFKILEKLA